MSTRGRLSLQLQIEMTDRDTYRVTAARGGVLYEGAGNSISNAFEDLACGFEDDDFEAMLEDGTMDDEDDES